MIIKKLLVRFWFIFIMNAFGGFRTHDLQIFSLTLSQLSYKGCVYLKIKLNIYSIGKLIVYLSDDLHRNDVILIHSNVFVFKSSVFGSEMVPS